MLTLLVDILPVYEWLFCYLWVESRKKFDSELHAGRVSNFFNFSLLEQDWTGGNLLPPVGRET